MLQHTLVLRMNNGNEQGLYVVLIWFNKNESIAIIFAVIFWHYVQFTDLQLLKPL